ncbi:MAG TPA: helix-turn-helix domain-containing protein [Solirubrobacteraceae bacterium]|nr:helix-turn-helix domain-containing protein [Solirubrobacteraceae bacterium]
MAQIDRAAAVRSALRSLVAERGFHGTSMNAVARAAGVATGTAYTYYESKDALVLAAYVEAKAQLGARVIDGVDRRGTAAERFRAIWVGTYRYLAANPECARFLLQVDDSPYRTRAHDAIGEDDPLRAEASSADLLAELLPLPLDVLYELGVAPAVRLAAAAIHLNRAELDTAAAGCWRAISQEQAARP